MTSATKEAIEFIKGCGFTHIKFELEGDIGRDGDRRCEECEGHGSVDCHWCEGEGFSESDNTTRISGDPVLTECNHCSGEGTMTCGNCGGEGTSGSYYDEETCDSFMKSYVPVEVRQRLTHAHFYEDGSVDSEFTCTFPVDNLDDFHHWVKAFKALAEEECNSSIDVHGAGMHITLLRGGDFNAQTLLPRAKLANFTREVSKLLPALFFIASAGHQSRGLGYRQPQISSREKYSAIYTQGGRCIEYRLFETCYNRPDAVYEYIQAIAKTLKFYKDARLTVKELGKRFGFSDGSGSIARFYDTPEQLRILNSTIKEIKPKDKSFKKLKEDRGLKYTIKELTTDEKIRMSRLRREWGMYINNWHSIMCQPLTREQQREYDFNITEFGRSPDMALLRAKNLEPLGTFENFVSRNTSREINNMVTV